MGRGGVGRGEGGGELKLGGGSGEGGECIQNNPTSALLQL